MSKIPISQMDEYAKKLPKGLRQFVDSSLDLIDLNDFLEEYKQKGGVLDGYNFHYSIINWFLNLRMEFDISKAPEEFKNIKSVKDLPESQIKDCLFYLNYLLGTTVHTGGHDYCKMYDILVKTK